MRNDESYRRESARVLVKGAGQSGVQSEWVGTTSFRRIVKKDSCFEFEQVRHVLRVFENTVLRTPRESRNSDFDSTCSCRWHVRNVLFNLTPPLKRDALNRILSPGFTEMVCADTYHRSVRGCVYSTIVCSIIYIQTKLLIVTAILKQEK